MSDRSAAVFVAQLRPRRHRGEQSSVAIPQWPAVSISLNFLFILLKFDLDLWHKEKIEPARRGHATSQPNFLNNVI